MSTSEARINANRLNASRSTGPRTEEGKERSRANALKHGMTGAGVVIPESDAAEVERRSGTFAQELQATGDVQIALAHRAALNSVRMERGADQQSVAMMVRFRQAEADFVRPEGVSDEEADRLRTESGRLAMFDPSKDACRARQYEAAAERSFYRALKELRLLQKPVKTEPKVVSEAEMNAVMGSFLSIQQEALRREIEMNEIFAEYEEDLARRPTRSPQIPPSMPGIDIPITVGRRR